MNKLKEIRHKIFSGDKIRVKFTGNYGILSGHEFVGVVVKVSPQIIIDVDGTKLMVTNNDEVELLTSNKV